MRVLLTPAECSILMSSDTLTHVGLVVHARAGCGMEQIWLWRKQGASI